MPDFPQFDTNAVLAHVRSVAGEFVKALESAQRQTGNWSDHSRTDELVHASMQQCLRQLAESNCQGEATRPASNVLWDIAGSWLRTGWLQCRGREKPRGYAGDFELLAKIDSNFNCDDPLGRSFDAFFQNQAAPQAVRNRHQWLRREMVDVIRQRNGRPAYCVSVGCGPACDTKAALADLTVAQRDSTRVTLLDLDPAAIEFVRQQLSGLLPGENLQAIRENLYRLSRVTSKSVILSGADLLSCPGLFDYLSDPDATALLATFWKHLAPGGRLVVFNFAPQHPSQAYMEWIGNWYLTYRNQADLEILAEQSGIPRSCVTVSSESSRTSLVLQADKPSIPRA